MAGASGQTSSDDERGSDSAMLCETEGLWEMCPECRCVLRGCSTHETYLLVYRGLMIKYLIKTLHPVLQTHELPKSCTSGGITNHLFH